MACKHVICVDCIKSRREELDRQLANIVDPDTDLTAMTDDGLTYLLELVREQLVIARQHKANFDDAIRNIMDEFYRAARDVERLELQAATIAALTSPKLEVA